ncbi:unnamed protein product [Urochloa humidicola]
MTGGTLLSVSSPLLLPNPSLLLSQSRTFLCSLTISSAAGRRQRPAHGARQHRRPEADGTNGGAASAARGHVEQMIRGPWDRSTGARERRWPSTADAARGARAPARCDAGESELRQSGLRRCKVLAFLRFPARHGAAVRGARAPSAAAVVTSGRPWPAEAPEIPVVLVGRRAPDLDGLWRAEELQLRAGPWPAEELQLRSGPWRAEEHRSVQLLIKVAQIVLWSSTKSSKSRKGASEGSRRMGNRAPGGEQSAAEVELELGRR